MRWKAKSGAAAAALLAIAGCERSDNGEQQNADNQSAAESNAGGTYSVSTAANASHEAPTGEVSSGMPVPGTNTPEHIVVNSDSGNSAGNSG